MLSGCLIWFLIHIAVLIFNCNRWNDVITPIWYFLGNSIHLLLVFGMIQLLVFGNFSSKFNVELYKCPGESNNINEFSKFITLVVKSINWKLTYLIAKIDFSFSIIFSITNHFGHSDDETFQLFDWARSEKLKRQLHIPLPLPFKQLFKRVKFSRSTYFARIIKTSSKIRPFRKIVEKFWKTQTFHVPQSVPFINFHFGCYYCCICIYFTVQRTRTIVIHWWHTMVNNVDLVFWKIGFDWVQNFRCSGLLTM